MPDTVTGTAQETPAEKTDTQEPNGQKTQEATKQPEKTQAANGKHQPPPGSERFDQIYGKWKDAEKSIETLKTKLKEHEDGWDVVRQHNAKLEAELEAVKRSKADRAPDPEPNFEEDPGAWRKWKAHQDAIREKQHEEELDKTRMDTLLTVEKRIHSDYVDMAKIAERDAAKDKELAKRIYGADNPFAEAYEYGRRKTEEMKEKEKEEKQREENQEKLDVEKGGGHEESEEVPEEDRLNDTEKTVAHRLFSDIEPEKAEAKYLKQKKEMAKTRR